MKVCIIGKGLTSLTLAKSLVNKGIYVDILSDKKISNYEKFRTIGISKTNIDFFNNEISNINKLLWKINKINIFSENLKNERLLNFVNLKNQLISINKNDHLYNHLIKELKKNKFFQDKKLIYNEKNLQKKYNIIVNCDLNNFLSKKYFNKKLNKKYNSFAYATIIKHKKFNKNNTAVQVFTKKGPIAFLPISEYETSIVYSVRGSEHLDLKDAIKKYNTKYSIVKINKILKFELKSMNLRSYYYKNFLAFGDLLHKLHPLAGQGFNMSLRDTKILSDLIKFKINHGLEIDKSICKDFEKITKHKNYLFSNGVDFIYEFFNFESKLDNPIVSKSVQFLGNNRYLNSFFTKMADKGLMM